MIVGKEDWLFFQETIDDFTSKNTLSDTEIKYITKYIEQMRDYSQINGAKFIFTIAPNKASLYPQYLPYYYKKSNQPNNMDKLVASLDGIDYLDLKSLFNNQSEVLYHKWDSHWNNKGALLVANNLLEHIGLNKNEYGNPQSKEDWDGDLHKMLFPSSEDKDIQYYYDNSMFDYSYTKRFKSTDDMTIKTKNDKSKNGNILLFRDSFGRSLLPFIGQSFSKATLSRNVPYNLEQIENEKFDYVVLEIVERNIKDLLHNMPQLQIDFKNTDVDINNLREIAINSDCSVEYTSDKLNYINVIPKDREVLRDYYISIDDKYYNLLPYYQKDENDNYLLSGYYMYTNSDIKNIKNIKIYVAK